MSRHALVTGATGGLGRELVRQLLEHGYRVTATGRDPAIGATLGTVFIPADLVRDSIEPLVEGVDVVFHLAALSSPWGKKAQFRAINIDATERLLRTAKAAGCGAFIYASTPSIYAENRDRIGLTEADPVAARFANDYAATKYAAECAVLAANTPAFRTVAMRPRAIVGRHDTVLLPRLLRSAESGTLALPGGGAALIELTDVRDAADAFVAADQHRKRAAGQAFNISGGDPRPLRELLEIIFARSGHKVRYRSVPIGVAHLAAGLAERIASIRPGRPEPRLTRYAVTTLGYSQTMDLTRAKSLLDWQPRYSVGAMVLHVFAEKAQIDA